MVCVYFSSFGLSIYLLLGYFEGIPLGVSGKPMPYAGYAMEDHKCHADSTILTACLLLAKVKSGKSLTDCNKNTIWEFFLPLFVKAATQELRCQSIVPPVYSKEFKATNPRILIAEP